jgi:hypothetical protein
MSNYLLLFNLILFRMAMQTDLMEPMGYKLVFSINSLTWRVCVSF